ncbi:hypothetical protein RhiTH_003516 [Rhizoctonia solani]
MFLMPLPLLGANSRLAIHSAKTTPASPHMLCPFPVRALEQAYCLPSDPRYLFVTAIGNAPVPMTIFQLLGKHFPLALTPQHHSHEIPGCRGMFHALLGLEHNVPLPGIGAQQCTRRVSPPEHNINKAAFRDSKHTSKGRLYWAGNPVENEGVRCGAYHVQRLPPTAIRCPTSSPYPAFPPSPFPCDYRRWSVICTRACPSSDIDVGSGPVVGSVFCLGWKVEEIKKLRERLKAAGAYIIYPTRGVPKPSNPLDHISVGDKHADLCLANAPDDAWIARRLIESVQVLVVLAWRMGAKARWSEGRAITGIIVRPGAFGMTEIDSPIIPTEMLPVPSSNVTPNMNLPTPNPANDSGSGPDAFSASGLTFNADGSINLGLADEGGAYNAGFGSDPGSGSGSGLGKGASSSGQTFPRSIRSPSFMFSAGSSVDPVNEHTRTRPPRRGRGRAGN